VALRSEFKISAETTSVSTHPAALFTKVSSLQNTLTEELLAIHGNLQKTLEYIKTDKKLSDSAREILKNVYRPKLIRELLQAVVDDDIHTAKFILDFDPKLLLLESANNDVTEIESKNTWHKFLTERPFIMAQKLKRLEMTKTLFSYFEHLENENHFQTTDAKNETLEIVKQWVLPSEISAEEQKQQSEKLQQEYIKIYFASLIETMAADNHVTVKWELDNEIKFYEARITNISKITESALETFRTQLLPETAIAIDKYVDIGQILIAAYKAYEIFFGRFQNWNQRDLFAICVIGFIQSLVSPELAKIFCPDIGDSLSDTFQLKNGQSFYRAARDSHSGLGFNFFCSIYEAHKFSTYEAAALIHIVKAQELLEKRYQAEAAEFDKLTYQIQHHADHFNKSLPSRCLIL